MDRTEELLSLFALHGFSSPPSSSSSSSPHQELHRLERNLAENLKSNSELLRKMKKLVQRREFSNDPTAELNEISEAFQKKLVLIKRDMEALTKHVNNFKNSKRVGSNGRHSEQHWSHIVAGRQKQVSADIEAFQNFLRLHGQHVQQRESRVTKFGQGNDQIRRGHSVSITSSASHHENGKGSKGYALFAPSAKPGGPSPLPRPVGRNQGVVRRRNNASSSSSQGSIPQSETQTKQEASNSNEISNMNQNAALEKGRKKYFSVSHPSFQYGDDGSHDSSSQKLLQRRNNTFRSEQSKKVEESIGKMGELFSQMTGLVKAQAETISRIEDDVEAGLEDTTEAHESLVNVYEITKGNRSLILKIFALLVFFIMLFMVWT